MAWALTMDEPVLTRDQLEKINRQHRLELRQIRRMNEQQFQAFKKNFSVGLLDNITRVEAEELLVSMLALNISMQNDINGSKKSVS